MSHKRAEELRLRGNACIAEKKYAEALLHYTHGIKEDTTSSRLYANRSLAFLRLQQYYYAIEDAKQCIDLDANWFKGYFRRAEVMADCGLHDEALKSYHLALHFLSPQHTDNFDRNEDMINAAIKKSLATLQKERAYDYQIPWVGAAIGLVAGMALITWDYVSNYAEPYVRHPILKLLIIGLVAVLFFYLAKVQRNYTKSFRETLLKPPIDLLAQEKQQ